MRVLKFILTFISMSFCLHGAILDVKKAYVSNGGNDTVSIIDTSTNQLTGQVTGAFDNPGYIAFSPDATKAFVTNATSVSGSNAGFVSVIDVATDTVIQDFPGFTSPEGIAVAPNGKKVYVANIDAGSVSIINLESNTVDHTGFTGLGEPVNIVITPDGTRAYVTDEEYDNVFVLDLVTKSILTTISGVFQEVGGLAVSPDGTKVYVTNSEYTTSTIRIINVADNTVDPNPIMGFSGPEGIVITADGSKAYVTNNDDNTVSVVDLGSKSVTTFATGFSGPTAIAITPDGTKLFVVNDGSSDGSVSVINLSTNSHTYIQGFNSPKGVVIAPSALVALENVFKYVPMNIQKGIRAFK